MATDLNRRSFLKGSSAAALASNLGAGAAIAQSTAGAGDVTLNAAFERIFNRSLEASPSFATSLGLDKGDKAHLRRTFDIKPYPQARAENVTQLREGQRALEAIPPVGSSRVDLQACKLEYSIVSPK